MKISNTVVHLVYSFGCGGLEKVIANLINCSTNYDVEHVLISLTDDISMLDMNLIFPSGELIQLDGHLNSDVKWNIYFKKIINDWNFDRGTIFLGDQMTDSPDSRGLHIRGNTNQIRFDDWVMQALNNVLGSKNKGGNLESKIRNSIVRQIKSIWGKKPKVEILFN